MALPVLSKAEKIAALEALAGADFVGAKVMLFTNAIVPTENTVLADLVAATFDGYAVSSAAVWTTVYTDPAGNLLMPAPSKEFVCTGSTVEETVYGSAIVDAAGTHVLSVEMLDDPVTIGGAPDGVIIVPRYML